jgi:hypothetical protein
MFLLNLKFIWDKSIFILLVWFNKYPPLLFYGINLWDKSTTVRMPAPGMNHLVYIMAETEDLPLGHLGL